ncbi:MAG: DUF1524 domain-containing protein [Yoonia sp.]|nr:DUF1524 domain-containing protein [Yoonia sp.]
MNLMIFFANVTLLIATMLATPVMSFAQIPPEYDRDYFGGWADIDRDCLNTRNELLAQLSTGPVMMSENGCRVMRGRWLDPYTDMIFTDSSNLDIDHLVPLHWAWMHGAWAWSDMVRSNFANDQRNLFAVDNGTNREKGAKGPLEWLPPSGDFACQYASRFWRVVLIYGLIVDGTEEKALKQQRAVVCADG